MSDLFGNHIVGFPTRRFNYFANYAVSQTFEVNDQQLKLHKNNLSKDIKHDFARSSDFEADNLT